MNVKVKDSVPVADMSKRGCSEEIQSSQLLLVEKGLILGNLKHEKPPP